MFKALKKVHKKTLTKTRFMIFDFFKTIMNLFQKLYDFFNLIYKKSVAASTITARMLKKNQRTPPLVHTKSDNFTKLDKLQDMAHLGLSEFVPRKSNKAEGTP